MKKPQEKVSKLRVIFLCLLAVFVICPAAYAQSVVSRQITASETNMPEITLTVTPDPSTTSYYVLEYLIPELTPINITGGGIVSYSEGAVKWGPFEDNLPRTFTYNLMGSATSFESAGLGRFSTDPPAQNPKTYNKVYATGDKVGTVYVPIYHSISVLEPGVVYQVTTQHFAHYSGQSYYHPTFYPELQILSALRDNIIGIRCYNGPDGAGFATFKKTAPYTTPVGWNIPELEVISVTAVPVTNPDALEVTWTFSLSSTNLWDVDGESLCIGIFTMTDVGDYGAYCDQANLTYTGGIPKVFKGKRGIYAWKEGNYIATIPQNQRDFFSFCAAPKGKSENKIESVIIALTCDMNGADNAAVRAFIAEAHSRNMEVHYVAGEPEWSFLNNRQIPVDEIDRIFTYNSSAEIEERFDSIQFDVEPHAIDTDNEPGMEPWVWEQYIQNMDYFKFVIDQNNSATGLDIPFAAAIGNFWHEDYVPTDAYTGTGYEQIINIIDKVVIMNYVTHYGAVFTCMDELDYARLLDKPVEIVYETFNTSPTESFWFNGNIALERIVNTIDYAYVDPFSPFYYDKMECNVIHYYEAEGEYFPYYGTIKRSYRELRPDIFSDYEPLIPTYNTAPVCYVLSPNGGEEINGETISISYEVYDDNSSVPVLVKFYLKNDGEGTEYYLGEQSVTVNSSTYMYSGNFTANVQSFPKTVGYRVLITVEEQSAVPSDNLSSLDSSNYDFTIIESGQPLPPVADAGGPYSAVEGNLISLSAGNSYSPEGLALTYAWDLNGDGLYDDAYGENVSHTWNDNGSFTVAVQVTDTNNNSDTGSAVVTISNAVPSVNAGAGQTVNVDDTVNFSGSFSDQGIDDTHTIEWNFGDNTTSEGTLYPSHSYVSAGIYTVTLTVTDDDGGVGTDTLTVTVEGIPLPPVADAGGPYSEVEGNLISLSAGNSYSPGGLALTYAWDLNGDGLYDDAYGQNVSHTWNDNGSFTVAVQVTDTNNNSDTGSAVVTISNAVPSVNAGAGQTVNVDDTVNFSGSFSDQGIDDTHTIEWNFGDNTTSEGTLYPSHSYASAGIYTVTLTVTDDDGGVGTDTLTVTVEDNTPPPVTHEELVTQINDIVYFGENIRCSRQNMKNTLLRSYLYPAQNAINSYDYATAVSKLNGAIVFLNKRTQFFNADDLAVIIADIQQLISDLELVI